jgi:hypothetical protein
MTPTIRHPVSMPSLTAGFGQPQTVHVTLPAPPWGALDHDDRSETAPRTQPIRLSGFDPLKHDPTIRHADRRKDRG